MYVTRIPNRDSPPAVLLRESYREGGKVRSRTLANISDWPEAKIDSLRRGLAGETLVPLGAKPFEIARALAHGHEQQPRKAADPEINEVERDEHAEDEQRSKRLGRPALRRASTPTPRRGWRSRQAGRQFDPTPIHKGRRRTRLAKTRHARQFSLETSGHLRYVSRD